MDEPREIESWKKISVLGSGSFGIVSLWQNQATDEYIAIKKCKLQSVTSLTDKQKRRWESEVAIMKTLACCNIVGFKEMPKILDVTLSKYNPSKLPLLSMEYCTKGNLRHVLANPRHSCGLPESDVREVLHDVTQAVKYLHHYKITHRDIKPENIVLQETSSRKSGIIYKLIDLGYAKELNDSVVSFVGTLHYLAPEIFKTENYNFSVDYWSLGVLTFEIICGVLPFLPYSTPVERFPYIEKKKSEHICIYKLLSGSIMNSSEILKENKISMCLKQNIETWLKHVLEFDPAKRSEKFYDNTDIFDYLLNILRKKIVTVFSLNTLEFYSYEINDGTLVNTLKNWIARDTKGQISDQILLTKLKCLDASEDNYVMNVIKLDDPVIYVFKRDAFVSRDTYHIPKYIRTLFENCTMKYTWRDLRPLYIKSVFYLWQEDELIKCLLTAFKLFVEYAKQVTENIKIDSQKIADVLKNLLIKLDGYRKIHKNCLCGLEFCKNGEYQVILLKFKRILAALGRSVVNANKLQKNVVFLNQRQMLLDKLFVSNIMPIIKVCDIQKLYNEGIALLTMTGDNSRQSLLCVDMVKIISKAMKEKDHLLNNNSFQKYAKATSVAVRDSKNLSLWMTDFQSYISELDRLIDDNQSAQIKMLLSEKAATPERKIVINGCVEIDAESVVNENQELRFQFEEMLNVMYVGLKKLCEETEPYLNQIF